MASPLSSDIRKSINAALREVVDAACVNLYEEDGERTHLGASIIGEDCAAKVWFGFRWAKHGRHSGQQHRLFQTGKLYESRFVEWHVAAGFEMFPFSENGEQWRITACEGHFGGSLDSGGIYRGVNMDMLIRITGKEKAEALAFALEPIRDRQVIVEFKTHNEKNYRKLEKNGVRLAFPKHFTQFSTYGTFYELTTSIYVGYNKNTDEYWPEVHNNDTALAEDMVRKAWEIITAQSRPPRIAEDQTYYECKFCSFAEICHNGAPMMKNCRSCRHAKASFNKTWICTYWQGQTIPDNVITVGCGQWAQIE